MIRTKCKAAMLMNGIAIVIAKMLPETNYYTCSRSGQMNKTARILTCKTLWCWISDAWAAMFFKITSDGLNQTLSSDKLQHEQRRASATSHCKTELKRRETLNTIKRIHRLYYTEHSIWQSTCNVSAGMHVQMNVLNSVAAVHTTYLTVLPYGRYYRLKNAMAPWVFLSFSIMQP